MGTTISRSTPRLSGGFFADARAAVTAAARAAAIAGAPFDADVYDADAFAAAFASDARAIAFAADAASIESGSSGADLAGLPLWPKRAPHWATEGWRTLKFALLTADEAWRVWTDWYEARLAGDADHQSGIGGNAGVGGKSARIRGGAGGNGSAGGTGSGAGADTKIIAVSRILRGGPCQRGTSKARQHKGR
jgi:uncharacterized membrane protein YgcG